ncbi:MAG: Flp family type IVb pilin [Eubacterium sp.]|nr:Flp family type IVb pilin [Eubacterium sp.]
MTFFKDENGQGMIEYALIIGLIAVAAIVILIAIRGRIPTLFERANSGLAAAETTTTSA